MGSLGLAWCIAERLRNQREPAREKSISIRCRDVAMVVGGCVEISFPGPPAFVVLIVAPSRAILMGGLDHGGPATNLLLAESRTGPPSHGFCNMWAFEQPAAAAKIPLSPIRLECRDASALLAVMEVNALKAALAASPDNVPLLLLVAKAHEDRFELDEARACLDRVVALQPDHGEALVGISRLLDLAGESSEAMVRLEALCGKQPMLAPAWLLRGRIALDEGDARAAWEFYDRAVDIDRSVADDDLLAAITHAGGGRKRSAITSMGPDEIEEGFPLGRMDAVTAHDLNLEFRLKADIRFSDVGGMEKVKNDIRMKIIHPLRNPELFEVYGKKAGGGVLMYGPPGCGKTLLARATAGEIEASFFSVGLHQVLDMYLGESEAKLHKIFELARKAAPAVLFFDEIDALAADRRDLRQSAGRSLINQFLAELDGAQADNEGLLILGATNAPWHVDGAFLRPGRFDRLFFVPPPDAEARREIAEIHARGKPLTGFRPEDLAKRTEGFSGADMRAVFDQATEQALGEAMRKGEVVPVSGKMLAKAAKEVKPSTRKWFESAKNYALYANQSGLYDDVLSYLGLKK